MLEPKTLAGFKAIAEPIPEPVKVKPPTSPSTPLAVYLASETSGVVTISPAFTLSEMSFLPCAESVTSAVLFAGL